MAIQPEQLSLLSEDHEASRVASVVASRPVVNLGDQQVTAFEYMSCDHYGFAHSNMQLSPYDMAKILDAVQTVALPEILLSVPVELFVEIDLSHALARTLRSLLSRGTHVTVLLAAVQEDAAHQSIGNAMQNWRRVGCSVGIDGFGYAAVPALWPLVYHVDVVRIDPRLISMLKANVIAPQPAQKLVNLVAAMGIPRIIIDGCQSIEDAEMFQAAGATHGQGPVFGECHFTQPR